MSWWMIHLLAFGNAFGMVMILVGIDRGLRALERRWKPSHRDAVQPAPTVPVRRMSQPVTQASSMCSRLVHVREGWHAR